MKVYSPEDNYKLSKVLLAAKVYGKEVDHHKVAYDVKVSKGFKEACPHFSLPTL